MTNVSKLPTPGVVLDLDIEERDEKDIKPPFVVVVGGRTITFADPAEIDWQLLAEVEGPHDLLRISLESEDRIFLNKQALKAWKFNRLMEAYYNHYDLEEKIREARRQAAMI